eukprot:bmy_17165T0
MMRSAVTGGGNVLGLKLVACIAKLEKAKGKELATKLGLMYTVEFSHRSTEAPSIEDSLLHFLKVFKKLLCFCCSIELSAAIVAEGISMTFWKLVALELPVSYIESKVYADKCKSDIAEHQTLHL